MTNEAIKRYSESVAGDVIQDYACTNTLGLEKGQFVQLLDPRTASGCVTAGAVMAGIVAREKIASDGRTQVAVHKKGYFDVVASGAIVLGCPVIFAGDANYPNTVKQADQLTHSGAAILGYAEETAADAETFILRLNL